MRHNEAEQLSAQRRSSAVQMYVLTLHNDPLNELLLTGRKAGANPEGQRLTKVDRADGPMATKKVPEEAAKALAETRRGMKNQKGTTMTQDELAYKAGVGAKYVKELEKTGTEFPSAIIMTKVQRAANVRLMGSDIGGPFFGPKKKDAAKK